MNSLRKTMPFVVILALLTLNVFLFLQTDKYKKRNNRLAADIQNVSAAQSANNNLKAAIVFQQLTESTFVPEIEIDDMETGSKILFSKLLTKNTPLLFFRFRETSCDGCVEHTVSMLTAMADHFPSGRLAILCGYSNTRQFNSFARTMQEHHFRVFNVPAMPVPADEQEQPYFFVLTADGLIRNVFIISKNEEELTAEYLHLMGHKYWDVHLSEE
jgi:hypothetical protein